MKVIAISDLHGHLPELPKSDLLILAGDITPAPYYPIESSIPLHVKWLDTVFRYWLDRIVARGTKVIAIAGNHDITAEYFNWGLEYAEVKKLPWHYLQDSGCEFNGFKIWGSPWTKKPSENWLYEWSFAAADELQTNRFGLIPNDTQILITHAPPKGCLDTLEWQGVKNLSVGSVPLASRLKQLTAVKLHVFGHIHEAFGSNQLNGVTSANVSLRDKTESPRENGWFEFTL